MKGKRDFTVRFGVFQKKSLAFMAIQTVLFCVFDGFRRGY
jgi:hypothetical protein